VVCTASEGQNGIKTDYHTEQLLNDPNTDKFTKYIISQISTTNDPEQKKYLYQCLAQGKTQHLSLHMRARARVFVRVPVFVRACVL